LSGGRAFLSSDPISLECLFGFQVPFLESLGAIAAVVDGRKSGSSLVVKSSKREKFPGVFGKMTTGKMCVVGFVAGVWWRSIAFS